MSPTRTAGWRHWLAYGGVEKGCIMSVRERVERLLGRQETTPMVGLARRARAEQGPPTAATEGGPAKKFFFPGDRHGRRPITMATLGHPAAREPNRGPAPPARPARPDAPALVLLCSSGVGTTLSVPPPAHRSESALEPLGVAVCSLTLCCPISCPSSSSS